MHRIDSTIGISVNFNPDVMNHLKALEVINSRINALKKEIEKCELILEEPEMSSDIYYAESDIENFNNEIKQLTETMMFLYNSMKP